MVSIYSGHPRNLVHKDLFHYHHDSPYAINFKSLLFLFFQTDKYVLLFYLFLLVTCFNVEKTEIKLKLWNFYFFSLNKSRKIFNGGPYPSS